MGSQLKLFQFGHEIEVADQDELLVKAYRFQHLFPEYHRISAGGWADNQGNEYWLTDENGELSSKQLDDLLGEKWTSAGYKHVYISRGPQDWGEQPRVYCVNLFCGPLKTNQIIQAHIRYHRSRSERIFYGGTEVWHASDGYAYWLHSGSMAIFTVDEITQMLERVE